MQARKQCIFYKNRQLTNNLFLLIRIEVGAKVPLQKKLNSFTP